MKAVGAAPVLVFSDHVLQPVLLYWYDVYNTLLFFIFFGKKKKKAKEQRKRSLSSRCEMNILSLCNPPLSPPHFRAEWIADPKCY